MRTPTLLLTLVVALAGASMVRPATAQDAWPTKPVKLLVPFAPGGNTDVIARMTADWLATATKGTFVVENQPGAAGLTVTAAVARAAPDGYTLFLAASPQMVIAPAMQQVSFDTVRDFTPVKIVATNPMVLTVHRSLPAKDTKGLVEHVRANRDKFTYATGGQGSVSHLSPALFFSKLGLDVKAVHYRGNAPAMVDVLAGHVPMMFSNLSDALAQKANESIRFLAVTSGQRIPQLPDVPTVMESAGIKDYDLIAFNGVVGPAGLPKDVVSRIERIITERVTNPEVQGRLIGMGLTPDLSTSAQFAERIRRELPLWADVVRLAGAAVQKQ